MKAIFKDDKKIIINSMDFYEAIVGKTFMNNVESHDIKIEQRYDVNDDFDGLVISLVEKAPIIPEQPTNPSNPTEDDTTTEDNTGGESSEEPTETPEDNPESTEEPEGSDSEEETV